MKKTYHELVSLGGVHDDWILAYGEPTRRWGRRLALGLIEGLKEKPEERRSPREGVRGWGHLGPPRGLLLRPEKTSAESTT